MMVFRTQLKVPAIQMVMEGLIAGTSIAITTALPTWRKPVALIQMAMAGLMEYLPILMGMVCTILMMRLAGGNAIANLDTDGDGITNAYDRDSDNDGIPDVLEAAGSDGNNDGVIDFYFDSDGDGFSNDIDGDSDNDGTAENAVGALIITGADAGNGVPISYPRANNDKLGMPNPYDLDDDGDGILDAREAGLAADANNDGIADGTLGADGWSDAVDAIPLHLTSPIQTWPDLLITSILILMTMD